MILLSARGYITVHAYAGGAYLPLQDVAITVTAKDGTALAMRLTDRNGQISPIEIPVPELSAGQSPDSGVIPYTSVNLHARLRGYEQIVVEGLQVFPDITTNQNLEMIPLPELPGKWNQTQDFQTPPQNL